MPPANPREYERAVAAVKARVARWPSAYASGQVVAAYKRAMAARGERPYAAARPAAPTPLGRWFAEKWVDLRTGKPCGAVSQPAATTHYPTCRPTVRVTAATPTTAGELTRAQKTRMVAAKQRAGPATVRY